MKSTKRGMPDLFPLINDIATFCELGGGLRLRSYQAETARAIINSIFDKTGMSFVTLFPRQSGKNEIQAQLEAYLLVLFADEPVEIVKVSPTWVPQAKNAMRRLERVLRTNLLTKERWKKEAGHVYRLGQASITFLSGSPTAHSVGMTASLLLECDEAQDVTPAKWDKDFAPMTASTNATCALWGTAWTADTLLAREGRLAKGEDGRKRFFHLSAERVAEEVPAYGIYLRGQLARLGRQHPLIKTQFYGEEIESEGGLFPPHRLALLQGEHLPQDEPTPGCIYAMLVDVAGEEEAPLTSAAAISFVESRASRPERDATALTVVEVDVTSLYDELQRAPSYRVVQRQLWTGIPHTELYGQLKGLAEHWNCTYFVVDATGVGAGLASFLGRALGLAKEGGKLIPFNFSGASKSKLGWNFLALIDSGRFKEYMPDSTATGKEEQAEELHSLFMRQACHCRYEVRQGQAHTLRWGVPATMKDPVSGGRLHDDLIISAALCSLLDEQNWSTGEARSEVIPPVDPLDNLSWDSWEE